MGLCCEKLEISSRFLGRSAGGLLLLPDTESDALRALVLLHGAREGPETILENSQLATLSEALSLPVLLPELGFSFGLDWGAGQNYRSFLMLELLGEARTRCPAFGARTRCVVGGISMGGFAAISLALSYPDAFGKAFSISGALDPRRAVQLCRISGISAPVPLSSLASRPEAQLVSLMEDARPKSLPQPSLYLAWGDADWFASANAAFAGRASEAGYPVQREIRPGFHDWNYWRESLPPALRWAAE